MKKPLLRLSLAWLLATGCWAFPPGWPAAQAGLDVTSSGVEIGSEVLAAADQTELLLRHWKLKQAKGVAFLVHGLKDHSGRYGKLAHHLNGLGYSVYAMDLRGHGRSGGERQYVESFGVYLQDLDQMLQVVRKREPGLPLLLFGHSMGGAIATLYTLHYKPALQGLILSAPALKAGKDVSPLLIWLTQTLSGLLPGLPVLHLELASFSRDATVLISMQDDPLIEKPDGPARTAAELLNAMAEIQTRMAEIKVPLLILHGTGDGITNPDGSKLLYEKASSSHKQLKLYDGLYHVLLEEPEQADVYRDLESWIQHLP